jgi:hypothetical protein
MKRYFGAPKIYITLLEIWEKVVEKAEAIPGKFLEIR